MFAFFVIVVAKALMLYSFRVLICKVFARDLAMNLFKALVAQVFVHTTVAAVVNCEGITAYLFQAFASTCLLLLLEFFVFQHVSLK